MGSCLKDRGGNPHHHFMVPLPVGEEFMCYYYRTREVKTSRYTRNRPLNFQMCLIEGFLVKRGTLVPRFMMVKKFTFSQLSWNKSPLTPLKHLSRFRRISPLQRETFLMSCRRIVWLVLKGRGLFSMRNLKGMHLYCNFILAYLLSFNRL